MEDNKKKFNIYVFVSSFARNLIEVFIPLILYNVGYSLKEVILYYFLVNLDSLIIGYIIGKNVKKQYYKKLTIIGILAFILLQVMLNNISHNLIYLVILAFLFALYRRGYWISRRYYNLKIIPNKNISLEYTFISIINQLAVMTSAYIGSLILDYFNITVLTTISIVLFFISIIPLYFLKIDVDEKEEKIELFNTLKKIPFSKKYLFGTYELMNVIKFLIPLYLAIYVKNQYQVVGVLNLVANMATLIFSYLYGKKINGNKNFIKISVILIVIIYVLKINIVSSVLILIALLEGFITKMQEISVNKEFYQLSKKFDCANYNIAYECIQNFTRTIVVLILLMFNIDIKAMIYISLGFVLMNLFLDFKDKY